MPGDPAQGGGTLLGDAFFDASTIAEGTFADQELVVMTEGAVPAGNLFLSLQSTGPNRAHFDDVRLAAVPEPATWVLALVGFLGLVYRRRSV